MMKAKKHLGQHFLNQASIAHRIAQALHSDPAVEDILEIGPGRGMLTQYLINRNEQLHLVEIDEDLIASLHKQFPNAHIIKANFLKLDLSEIAPAFHLIGNFPYNISSQIIFKLLEYRHQIPQMVGMFQKEVAQRIASAHGTKQYGILSVLTQSYFDIEYLFEVRPGAFSPPPKVQSAVIRMHRRTVPKVSDRNFKFFKTVVKLAFNQRRKMLRNSLKSLLSEAPTDPMYQMRPEQLSVDDFVSLTAKLITSHGTTSKENREDEPRKQD